ncbi:MFS transporter [Planomonospora sp. ID67723]|uniref:MFS transporter n=1 Tax=Planomonospora sp. ID67723 TaxID=2738134 RepID=UPI0018C3E435|nr:MFS transporter [Planomonospora sp. ID67723]MBG0827231.1 MFS transporter [Planomonospora sp. ID67723]
MLRKHDPIGRPIAVLRRTGSQPWGIVAALAVTSTVGYGVMFYSFAVFLGPVARDLHTGSAQVTGAFALAIAVNAAVAPFAGRLLDRYGGRWLMTAGSVLATLTVLGWSQVESLAALYAVFACMGVAMALTLYEPAFAVVVSWFDGGRRATALLAVTVVAGFATTIFSPLAGLLGEWYGWRHALVVLAVVLGAVTVPLHLIAVRRGPGDAHPPKTGAVGDALKDPSFWLLTGAFVAQSGAVYTLAVHLVSYLTSLGHPVPFASLVTGLVGVLSVTGRLATTGMQRRWPAAAVSAAMFTVQAAGVALLPVLGGTAAGAIACVLLFGLGYGVGTIARPVLFAEHFGTANYGAIAGAATLPIALMTALGPLAGAGLEQAVGYTSVMVTLAVLCVLAAVTLILHHRRVRVVP